MSEAPPEMTSRTPFDDHRTDSGAASTVPPSVDSASEVAERDGAVRGISQGRREGDQTTMEVQKRESGTAAPVKPNQSTPSLCAAVFELTKWSWPSCSFVFRLW